MTYTRKVTASRSAVVDRYGPPEVVSVEAGVAPTPSSRQLLVRVESVAVTAADARIRAAALPRGFGAIGRVVFGLRGPRRPVLGRHFSGVVDAVGADATGGYAVGDAVVGSTGGAMGAHATHVVVDASRVVRKPPALTHDDAAAVLFGGSAALHYLWRKATIEPGTTVLINGASGALGTIGIQLARLRGATVTAVTSSANTDLVRRLGADDVIDYRRTELSTVRRRFDVIFDTVGTLSPATSRPLLTDRGVALLAVATLGETVRAVGRIKAGPAPERPADFAELLRLVEQGDLTVPLDRVVDFDGLVDAYRRIDSGRKVGNIVLRPNG